MAGHTRKDRRTGRARFGIFLMLVLFCAAGIPQAARPQEREPVAPGAPLVTPGPVTGYPIPRMVTLKDNEVNVRRGPGLDYPVKYIYLRAGYPVEITAEFGHWRRIRDIDGDEGWVYKNLLDGARAVIVTEVEKGSRAPRPIFAEPHPGAKIIALLEPGVIARYDLCRFEWCRIEADGLEGWIARSGIWGQYAWESVDD